MVFIERISSLSSSSSTKKTRRQSLNSENEKNELANGKPVKRASSFSSLKEKKQVQSCSIDGLERLKTKLIKKSSSFSSLKEKKQVQCCSKDGLERLKTKPIKKSSSFSSLPSTLRKEKLVRGASSLSSCKVESPKRVRKSLGSSQKDGPEGRKSSVVKSKIRELGPVCRKRKDVSNDDIEGFFDKQIDEGTMINPDDCFWLSSGSMSPHEFGMFMNAIDPCLDEWVISFVPKLPASHVPVKGALLSEDVKNVQESVQETAVSCTSNSAFWNMDRTGVWVSLINLESDSRLISDAISENEDLDSDFPSPTYEANWDSYSSARSTHESSQSDFSSDLLSDSLDWEQESDDPIFWPFGLDSDWDQTVDSFSVSPRKGMHKEKFDSEDERSCNFTDNSIKFRLHGQREGSKDGIKRKILFVSGLSASKIIEFKKGCRKKFASSKGTSQKRSRTAKRGGRFGKRVPPILETDLEGISPKDTPTKQTENLVEFTSDIMCSSEDNWADDMDSDGPLVWPSDQKTDWNVTCDFLNISPRKNVVNITNFGSPNSGFTVSSSIRLKFRPMKKAKIISSLGASKSLKFKPASHKTVTNHSRKRVNASPLRLSPSWKSLVVVIPPKKTAMFKPVVLNQPVTRVSTGHEKRIRAMPMKVSTSVDEFIRMFSAVPGDASGDIPIETFMGLNEFDGHEGVDMDFEEDNFTFEEYM